MPSKKYGLIGEKLGHSFSKLIHNRLGSYDYELYSVAREDIDEFVRNRTLFGANVTIPYKKTVMAHCDVLTEAAKKIGCVNCLTTLPDGRLMGDNTDYAGFLCLADSVGIDFNGSNVVILGSGGTSLTARTAARDRGAESITIISRGGEHNYDNITSLKDTEIIINTTPVGMFPNNGEKKVDLSQFPKLRGVLDVVYNPMKTALLLQAEKLGIPCGCGLRMLVAQAKYAAERFTDSQIDDSRIDEIETELKKQLTNIVLIGMPGSGKSSIAAKLAESMGREIAETDKMIEQAAKMTIPQIFERYGEEKFREMESEAVKAAGSRTGIIISTGGGAVKNPQNIDFMRQNGVIAWVKRPIEQLATDGRPLSRGENAAERLWQERRELYLAAADFAIDNSFDIESAAKAAEEGFYENIGDKRP